MIPKVKYRVEELTPGKFSVIKDIYGHSSVILHTCPDLLTARRIKNRYAGPKRAKRKHSNASPNG